ncbi:MAG: NADH dehydrogenase [Lachnospiraceae bacterium]|nr:NADH dehydrogenase [Lachnospiraceae bacterium]
MYGFSVPVLFSEGLVFSLSGFRRTYCLVTALMWFGTTVFSMEYFKHERRGLNRYFLYVLMTLGATEGVMLSGNMMTSFVFFEILSFTSFTWVIHEETKEAVRAGYTYLFIAVIGGLILFMGMALLYHTAGTLNYDGLLAVFEDRSIAERGEIYAAGICILLGFGAKAGMFPLHIWLPKAHPVAPSPGSALLSGVLTKVGIYGILMSVLSVFSSSVRFGLTVMTAGVITMFLGALLALFSVNLKRTLACSSMSQIGFILTGLAMYILLMASGEHHAACMTLAGSMLHMVNHSMIKLVLFMAAGVVVMNIHVLTLNEIRGFGVRKNALKAAFLLGALGISGVPFFNGYISKTLIHEGIVEAIEFSGELAAWLPGLLHAAEWIFLISGGLTFAYMCKLFICVFIQKNKDPERQKAFDADRRGMGLWSTLVICVPSLFMIILGNPAVIRALGSLMSGEDAVKEFMPFTFGNLKGGFISLAIGAAVYLIIVRRVMMRDGQYLDLWPEKLDLEELVYRPLLTRILPGIFGKAAAFIDSLPANPFFVKTIPFLLTLIGRTLASLPDALIVLLRKSVVRERSVQRGNTEKVSGFRVFVRETYDAAAPLVSNFSFALLMTCIGIVVIFGAVIYLILTRM